jgi:hypothetical protein
MDRRKDTNVKSVRLPKDYLSLVEEVFNKNFGPKLLKEKGSRETFVAGGEIFPDELILVLSLKHPGNLRMTTCYASVDYPPAKMKKTESGAPAPTSSEMVQVAVNQCVDAVASFFNTFFDEGRPVDYDLEYRQNWTAVEIEKNTFVYLKINRDNPELEAQADALLEKASVSKKKKNLH